jgi:phenylacetic acid degradation operon negative regulatory protein
VLASVLLGTDPPWLPTPLLVRTTALFGISEGSTRTALSRLVAACEAEATDGGYRLAGRMVARQARQQASREATVRPWDGTWELAVVDGTERRAPADRAALRQSLLELRLAELREGVWARPDNLDPNRAPTSSEVVGQWCTAWSGASPSPRTLGRDLWDLRAWADEAGRLGADMERHYPRLVDGDMTALADGFVTAAAVLRHLQADPLLPEELLDEALDDAWPGTVLRTAYDRYDAAYRAVLRTWFRQ